MPSYASIMTFTLLRMYDVPSGSRCAYGIARGGRVRVEHPLELARIGDHEIRIAVEHQERQRARGALHDVAVVQNPLLSLRMSCERRILSEPKCHARRPRRRTK